MELKKLARKQKFCIYPRNHSLGIFAFYSSRERNSSICPYGFFIAVQTNIHSLLFAAFKVTTSQSIDQFWRILKHVSSDESELLLRVNVQKFQPTLFKFSIRESLVRYGTVVIVLDPFRFRELL